MSVHDRKAALSDIEQSAARAAADIAPDPVVQLMRDIAEFKAAATFEAKLDLVAAALGVPVDVVKALADRYGRATIEHAVQLALAQVKP